MKKLIILFLAFLTALSLPINYVAPWPQSIPDPVFPSASPEIGPLRKKAVGHDAWNAQHHHPYYGGQVYTIFTDETYTTAKGYDTFGDSCIWTGTYLGSQALRYKVTGDTKAKENAIKSVHALHGFLKVTNVTGYIARYQAPKNSIIYKGDKWCEQRPKCRKVTHGKYAGDFWEGDTTKDQYTGWFFGMYLAYDFIDDQETKELIKTDIMEVVDKLIKDGWIIQDEKGKHHVISAGPRPTLIYQLAWLTIAYHLSGHDKYKHEIEKRLTLFNFWKLIIGSYFGFFGNYNHYYGHNLAHTTWYILLRLGKVYFAPETHEKLKKIFSEYVYCYVRLAHNPWFNGIFMSQGNYKPKDTNDPYKDQLLEDLTAFRPAPNYDYFLPEKDPKTYTLDPVTGWLKYYPRLRDILSKVKFRYKPQAREPFPIPLQCHTNFLFQRTPYELEKCGSNNKLKVQPGHDYLVAYWLASYHGFLTPDQ